MARGYIINGESLVYVKGNSASAIASRSELGLSDDKIHISFRSEHEDIKVDAAGRVPPEIQYFGDTANITMTLVNFDPTVLQVCQNLSKAGAPAIGQAQRAGALMGNGFAQFGAGNNFISLSIASPVGQLPWRFYFAYLADNPIEWPLGTERTVVQLNWRAIPYTVDPWNGGLGMYGVQWFDHTLDT